MSDYPNVRLEFLRFPYVFWLKKTKDSAQLIDSNSIKVDDTVYSIKVFAKYKYILLKYIPVALLFITVLSRHDFDLTITKCCEIIGGAMFAVMLMFVNNKSMIALLAVIFWTGITIVLKDGMVLSYSLKYFVLSYVLLQIFNDIKNPKTIYEIRAQDGTLLSHLTNYERISE